MHRCAYKIGQSAFNLAFGAMPKILLALPQLFAQSVLAPFSLACRLGDSHEGGIAAYLFCALVPRPDAVPN
jgi:hypothetical protein